jgi:hypothetical protein
VTAVNIQIVYENPLADLNPLTAIARAIKNRIRTGPELSRFPEKIKYNEVIRKIAAKASAIL